MHLLFVTYDYLPEGSPEASLLSKMIPILKKNGSSIDVFTFKGSHLQSDIELTEDCLIYRTVLSNKISIRQVLIEKKYLMFLNVLIKRIVDKLLFIKAYGFLSSTLIYRFYKGMKKFNLTQYDAVIPVCGIYETYFATKKYFKKRKHKSEIIVYQIDPLTGNKNFTKKSYKNRYKTEKDMMYSASAIITTDIVKKEKIALNIDSDNVFPLEFPSITNMTNNNQSSAASDEIKCVFSGYIYNNIRNPEYTFKLFSKFNSQNIKLYIVGSGSEEKVNEYINAFPNRFNQVGSVPLEKSLEYIKNADILVNIGNNITNAVPSKIFDYISTGKPIINIYKNKDCPTLKYFEKYNNAISIFEDMDKIDFNTKAVESFINERLGKTIPYEEIDKNLRECTADYVANEFYKIISEVKEKNVSGEKS